MPTAPMLVDARGNPLRSAGPGARGMPGQARAVRARYDAAVATEETRNHWAAVDSLSARAANSPDVRRRLRTRARYEVANNSYAKGIVDTLANDTIGTGPRLQLLTPDAGVNRAVEQAFMEWADAIDMADKLRTMRKALAVDGEAFAVLITNPRLTTPVQLDVKLVEADQVTSPWLNPLDPRAVDGIHYDAHGNPDYYDVLRYHPGDTYQIAFLADPVDARRMIHWFRNDRPHQMRGIPDITPALPLFAQLRRYTLAVLAAAETAADFAAVLYSELPPEVEHPDDCLPFESLEIMRRMMITLPAGWKMGQFKAEQPSTSYPDFKREILNEIARCLNMPFNVAAGNSSSYNYASGRLDHQTYYKSINVDQSRAESVAADRFLAAWHEEARLAGQVPGPPGRAPGWPHLWFWDGHEHVDPLKEAEAQKTRLENNTTTLADEYARRGQDWESQLRQRARELDLMAELGLSPAAAPPARGPAAPPERGDHAYPDDDS